MSADHSFPVERDLSGALLTAIAGRVSGNVDAFSSWLFLGYSAAITFLLGNSSAVDAFLPKGWLPQCLKTMAITAALLLVEKSLALICAAGASGAAIGRELSAPIIASGYQMEQKVVLGEIERAAFWPGTILVRRSFAKVVSGDLAAPGRAMYRLGQIQAFVVGAQMLAIIWRLCWLARGAAF